jgi:carbonic anhydrase
MKFEEMTGIPEELSDIAIPDDRTALLKENYKDAVIICSDARIPPAAVADESIYVIATAGNVLDTQVGAFPSSIENVYIAAHRTDKGCGCGACGEASKMNAKSRDEIKSARESLPPQLFHVARTAKCTPEENMDSLLSELRNRGYNAGGFIIHNVDGTISDWEYDKTDTMEDLKTRIEAANADYLKTLQPEAVEKFNYLATTQIPKVIGLNKLSAPLAEVFGGVYREANQIFESKQGHDMTGMSDLAHGSLQYAWAHYRGEGSFSKSDITVFATRTEDDLTAILKQCETDPTFKQYTEKGGKAFGLVLDKDKATFYKITE